MAKKPRTPAPPRKVQAPKVRQRPSARPTRGWSLTNTNFLIGAGLAAVAALVIGVLLLRNGGGGGGGNIPAARAVMLKAGCSFRTVPSTRSALHLTSQTAEVTYNSYPPTSGFHYYQPAIWGNYKQVVNPRLAVHNQEHGGVVVWYGPKVSAADLQKIDEFYSESPNAMLVTPIQYSTPGVRYPPHKPLGSKIALTAWDAPSGTGKGVIAICPGVNLSAFRKFRDTFRGNGPERFPVNILTPGT